MQNTTPARAVLLIIVSALIASALASHAATAPFAKGIVVAEKGQPLHDVTVYGSKGHCCPFVPEVVKTDEYGFFQLEQPVKVIHFWQEGFRPVAVVAQSGGNGLRVVLEEASPSNWIVPACSNAKTENRLIGYGDARFSIPRGAKLTKHHSDEGSSFSVYLSKGSIPVELSWGGIHGSPDDDDFWILKSVRFSERWIKDFSSQPLGVDAEGETREAKRWRLAVFIPHVTASYDGISAERAKDYDALIDSACLEKPATNHAP
jgi:hypothetical protein